MEATLFNFLKSKISESVTLLFVENTKKELVYHNLEHTKAVVNHAMEIASHYQLTEEQSFELFAASWFHDTGQLFVAPRQHEEESIRLAGEFFSAYLEVPMKIVGNIERCILSTKMPPMPCTLIEKIICDADTYHFGTDEFIQINEKVKLEANLRGLNVDNWDDATIELLENHVFHTEYCKNKLDAGKQNNINLLHHLLVK